MIWKQILLNVSLSRYHEIFFKKYQLFSSGAAQIDISYILYLTAFIQELDGNTLELRQYIPQVENTFLVTSPETHKYVLDYVYQKL